MNEQWPEGVPPHEHVYFVVADADASAERIRSSAAAPTSTRSTHRASARR
jgi:hypothetical protein